MSQQFRGVQHRASAPKDKLNSTMEATDTRGGSPSDEQQQISYGEILAVHETRSTIDLKLFGSETRGDEGQKIFEVPLIHPLHFYHQVFGQLRPGLCVRIFWRGGRNKPGREAIAEIINDNTALFREGKKGYEPNTINTGPWQILSGGLG